jgi:hypothetical protein
MDQNTLKAMIDDLEYHKAELIEARAKTDEAIRALQEICEHKFVADGHDSHNSYEKCKYCSVQQKA